MTGAEKIQADFSLSQKPYKGQCKAGVATPLYVLVAFALFVPDGAKGVRGGTVPLSLMNLSSLTSSYHKFLLQQWLGMEFLSQASKWLQLLGKGD